MPAKKRETKRIPKYEQEELDAYHQRAMSMRTGTNEFVKIKELDFKLTKKQTELIETIKKNKIITVTGPPGTSKTFVACYAAVQLFLSGGCSKIIISKPTEVLSGTKDLGFLPGTLEDKIQVYAESFFDAFEEILEARDFKALWEAGVIEFKPAQFLRGRTLKNAVIIIDEYQNFDIKALKSIVTRLGRGSTMVFMGDTKQNDVNKKYVAIEAFNAILDGLKKCASFTFEKQDIVRDPLLIDIIDRFELWEDNNLMPETSKNT